MGLVSHSHAKPRIGIVTSAVAVCATPPLIAVSVLPLSHCAIDDFLLPEPPELHLSYFIHLSFFSRLSSFVSLNNIHYRLEKFVLC